MSANLIPASNRMNASVAGQTRDAEAIQPTPAQVGLTATETGDNLFGGLGDLVAGGVHPEAVPAIVARPLDVATDSVRGTLGGLRPKFGSVIAPGPAGSASAAKAVQAGTAKVTDATTAGAKRVAAFAARFRPKPKA